MLTLWWSGKCDQYANNTGQSPWACRSWGAQFSPLGGVTVRWIAISATSFVHGIRIHPVPACPGCSFLCSQCSQWHLYSWKLHPWRAAADKQRDSALSQASFQRSMCPKTHMRRNASTVALKTLMGENLSSTWHVLSIGVFRREVIVFCEYKWNTMKENTFLQGVGCRWLWGAQE